MRGAGIEIGARVVTLVVVNRGFKGVRIERALTRSIADGAEGLTETLRALKRDANLRAEPIAIGLPVHAVSTRVVTLPFTQRTKLDAVLSAELEGQLPFELDEVLIDGSVIAQASGRSRVLAVAAPKSTVKARLDEAAKAGIDPRVVTVDAAALAVASEAWLPFLPDLALVHLDDRSMSVTLVEGRRVRAMRGIVWDGGHAARLAAGERDSESAWRQPLEELRRTLHADAVESGRSIDAMALSGRWADLPEVGAFLAERLGLKLIEWPVQPVADGPRPLGPFAVAAGLAIAGLGREGVVDFRRGEFAYGRERAGRRKRVLTASIMAALVLMAGGVDLGVRATMKEGRYREVSDRVRAAFRATLPQVTTVVSEPDQLQAAIGTLAKQRAFLGGEVGVLDVLLTLTDAIPKESGIAVSEVVIDQDKVRIEAETTSFDWVNRIESALAKSPAVRHLAVSDAKTTADQSRIRFLMTITLAEGV